MTRVTFHAFSLRRLGLIVITSRGAHFHYGWFYYLMNTICQVLNRLLFVCLFVFLFVCLFFSSGQREKGMTFLTALVLTCRKTAQPSTHLQVLSFGRECNYCLILFGCSCFVVFHLSDFNRLLKQSN